MIIGFIPFQEKGFKMWGNEMNCDGTVLEAGLEAFVRMKKKSDFLGKKAVKAKMNDYLEQKLTMLEVDVENVDPEGNESVWLCNKCIGNTTSGCYSPALGKGLAFAYIPALADVPGMFLSSFSLVSFTIFFIFPPFWLPAASSSPPSSPVFYQKFAFLGYCSIT